MMQKHLDMSFLLLNEKILSSFKTIFSNHTKALQRQCFNSSERPLLLNEEIIDHAIFSSCERQKSYTQSVHSM